MILLNVPKNCMKLKEFGRGADQTLLCRSATGLGTEFSFVLENRISDLLSI